MKLKYLKNAVKLILNESKCIGCAKCVEVCPHSVYLIRDKKAYIIDKEACMECGACKKNCPVGAIEVGSGVGCAAGILNGILNKKDEGCGCSCSKNKSSCCG